MTETLFAKQDSLGLKSWASYARDAGVKDSAGFLKCAKSSEPLSSVTQGKAIGKSLKVTATPGVFING